LRRCNRDRHGNRRLAFAGGEVLTDKREAKGHTIPRPCQLMKVAACHSCETNDDIEGIRRTCANCPHDGKCCTGRVDDTSGEVVLTPFAVAEACPTFAKIVEAQRKCAKCRRVGQDDIRIRKTPHANREDLHRDSGMAAPSMPMELTDKAEATKYLIYEFSALSTVECIVLMHLARHGTARTAAQALERFVARVRKYERDTPSRASSVSFKKNAKRKKHSLSRAMLCMKIRDELLPSYPALRRLKRK